MNIVGQIIKNHLLITALLGWGVAQVTKAIISAIQEKSFDIHKLHSDGGMPSCHSSTVVSLAVSAGIYYGFDSAIFALSAIFAVVVMHDAMGVRQEAGKHAHLLNELMELIGKQDPELLMKEFLGHTPFQVLIGGIIGCAVGCICSLVIWPL